MDSSKDKSKRKLRDGSILPSPPRRREPELGDWVDEVREDSSVLLPPPSVRPRQEDPESGCTQDGPWAPGSAQDVPRVPGSRPREFRAPENWKAVLEERIRLLPRLSGVYLFRDVRGRVIYVGKAKQLHLRVRSYFRGPVADRKVRELRRRVRILDWVVTASEVEALVLEDSLIKQYAPRFNIRLKDDKRYPYVKVNLSHSFPGLYVTRRVVPDGSRYFGPFTRVKDLRGILKVLRSVFQLRNCTDRRLQQGGRECLQYFIGRCTAPCTARVDREQYGLQVRPLIEFLSGRGQEAVETLRSRMRAAAKELRFEESARLRDQIACMQDLLAEGVLTMPQEAEADLVGLASRGDLTCAVFLHLRERQVVGKSHRFLSGAGGESQGAVLRSLLLASFLNSARIPRRIICPLSPVDREGVEAALTRSAGYPVRLIRGERRAGLAHLLHLSAQNAHLLLEEEELRAAQKKRRVEHSVYALQESLGLRNPPYRIEGYDISNTQGAHPVASQVVFQDGKPLKSAYRRYRIKDTQGPDDFAMIAEVLARRLVRLRDEGEKQPDLILVDGGKGQVSRAAEILNQAGFAHLPLLGLAKREEEIVLPRVDQPIRLPRSSEALQLLQRVRDEAHRFAVGYHRGLRGRAARISALDGIPGIGPARRRALLKKFGSVRGLLAAGPDGVAEVPGIGPMMARTIWEALHEKQGRQDSGRGR